MRSVFFLSLGCAKNRVDTEVMLGCVARRGHAVVGTPEEADVIVINTCAFIGDAKQESIDAILEMAELKKQGHLRRLIVTGCLPQRYDRELARQLPEVDVFLGVAEIEAIGDAIDGRGGVLVSPDPCYLYDHRSPRLLSTPRHFAYVKIAEGCDRPCGFCAIPLIRGHQRSRRPSSIEAEVRGLARGGTVEVNLIAQDTTAYGTDLKPGKATLAGLLERLATITELRWLRVQYAYPTSVTAELLEVMAREPRVAKYLDVPLQHIDDEVLRLMRRGHGERLARRLVAEARTRVPGVRLRTTFLVGHPGETPAAFRRLLAFVEEADLDHVGAFAYSPEEGTHSASLSRHTVPPGLAEERRLELMELQRRLSRARLRRLIGRELEVQIEGESDESAYLLAGRLEGQAPEVDGQVYLSLSEAALVNPPIGPGDLVRACVDDAADYDLAATVLAVINRAPRPRTRLPVVGRSRTSPAPRS